MEITNKHLKRNPDGSLKIFIYKELVPFDITGDDSHPQNLMFIVGSYRVDGQKYAWRLPVSEQFVADCPPDALDSYVTQAFESHIKNLG
jgi:hypothetical protein